MTPVDHTPVCRVSRSGHVWSPGSVMLAAAEANRLGVINGIKLTMDGQYVVTASLCGPPQVRNVLVRSRCCDKYLMKVFKYFANTCNLLSI